MKRFSILVVLLFCAAGIFAIEADAKDVADTYIVAIANDIPVDQFMQLLDLDRKSERAFTDGTLRFQEIERIMFDSFRYDLEFSFTFEAHGFTAQIDTDSYIRFSRKVWRFLGALTAYIEHYGY